MTTVLIFWNYFTTVLFRNYSEALTCSQAQSLTGPRSSKSELPQKVLESLFNMPKSAEHEPNAMNWRDVVKKMEFLGQRSETDLADAAGPEHIHGNKKLACYIFSELSEILNHDCSSVSISLSNMLIHHNPPIISFPNHWATSSFFVLIFLGYCSQRQWISRV